MRFTLIYDGELPSTAHANAGDKMKLRRDFHRQLGEVWQRKAMLQKNWNFGASGRLTEEAKLDGTV